LKKIAVILILLTASNVFSQLKEYNYKAEIGEVSDSWHFLELPSESFAYLKDNYADVRIYGLSDTDTIEVPYVMDILSDKSITNKVEVTILNKTNSNEGSFFTLKNEQ